MSHILDDLASKSWFSESSGRNTGSPEETGRTRRSRHSTRRSYGLDDSGELDFDKLMSELDDEVTPESEGHKTLKRTSGSGRKRVEEEPKYSWERSGGLGLSGGSSSRRRNKEEEARERKRAQEEAEAKRKRDEEAAAAERRRRKEAEAKAAAAATAEKSKKLKASEEDEYEYGDDDWDDFDDLEELSMTASKLSVDASPAQSASGTTKNNGDDDDHHHNSALNVSVPKIPLDAEQPSDGGSSDDGSVGAEDIAPRSGRRVAPLPSDGPPSPGAPLTPRADGGAATNGGRGGYGAVGSSGVTNVSTASAVSAVSAASDDVMGPRSSSSVTNTSHNSLELSTSTLGSTMETLRPVRQPLAPLKEDEAAADEEEEDETHSDGSSSGESHKGGATIVSMAPSGSTATEDEDDLWKARQQFLKESAEEEESETEATKDVPDKEKEKEEEEEEHHQKSGSTQNGDKIDMEGKTLNLDFADFGKQWQASHPSTPSSKAADKIVEGHTHEKQQTKEEKEENEEEETDAQDATVGDRKTQEAEQRAAHDKRMAELMAGLNVNTSGSGGKGGSAGGTNDPSSPDWFDAHLKHLRKSSEVGLELASNSDEEEEDDDDMTVDSSVAESPVAQGAESAFVFDRKNLAGVVERDRRTSKAATKAHSNSSKSNTTTGGKHSGGKSGKKVTTKKGSKKGGGYQVSSRLYPGPEAAQKKKEEAERKRRGDDGESSLLYVGGSGKKSSATLRSSKSPRSSSTRKRSHGTGVATGGGGGGGGSSGRSQQHGGSGGSKSNSKGGRASKHRNDDVDDNDNEDDDEDDDGEELRRVMQAMLKDDKKQEAARAKKQEAYGKRLKELEETIDETLMEAQLSNLLAKQQKAKAETAMAELNLSASLDVASLQQQQQQQAMARGKRTGGAGGGVRNSVGSMMTAGAGPEKENAMRNSMLETSAEWSSIRREWAQMSQAKAEIKELEFENRLERLQYALDKAEEAKREVEREKAAQLALKDKKMNEMRAGYEEQVKELRIANSELEKSAAGNSHAAFKQRLLAGEDMAGINREELDAVRRELQELERLVDGYQRENERLVTSNRELQAQVKALQRSKYDENERLVEQINMLQTQVANRDVHGHGHGHGHGSEGGGGAVGAGGGAAAGGMAAMQERLREYEGEIAHLRKELTTREEDFRYELDKVRAASRREAWGGQQEMGESMGLRASLGASSSGAVRALKLEHEEEVAAYERQIKSLRAKIEWYVENQDLLTKHEMTIRQQKMTIKQLEEELQKALEESRGEGAGAGVTVDKKGRVVRRTPSRPADVKRIRELEEQVAELEKAIRERNPNSITALIAASNQGAQEQSVEVKFLQDRVSQLQEQLALKDEEMQVKVRTLRQEYEKTKAMYERRDEGGTSGGVGSGGGGGGGGGGGEGKGGRVAELEQQVEEIRAHFKRKVRDLESKVKSTEKRMEAAKERASKEKEKAEKAEKKAERLEKKLERSKSHAGTARVKSSGYGQSSSARKVSDDTEAEDREREEREQQQRQQEEVERLEKAVRDWRTKYDDARDELERLQKKQVKSGSEESGGSASGRGKGSDAQELVRALELGRNAREAVERAGMTWLDGREKGKHAGGEQHENEGGGSTVVWQVLHQLHANLKEGMREVQELREANDALETAVMQHMLQGGSGSSSSNSSGSGGKSSGGGGTKKGGKQSSASSGRTNKHLEKMLDMNRKEVERLTALVRAYEEQETSEYKRSPAVRHVEMLEARIHEMELRHQKRESDLEDLLTRAKTYSRLEMQKSQQEFEAFQAQKNREIAHFQNELGDIVDHLRRLKTERVEMRERISVLEHELAVERRKKAGGGTGGGGGGRVIFGGADGSMTVAY